jgi:hypothetical protein
VDQRIKPHSLVPAPHVLSHPRTDACAYTSAHASAHSSSYLHAHASTNAIAVVIAHSKPNPQSHAGAFNYTVASANSCPYP